MRASIALMNDHPLALGQEDEVRCGAFSERLGPLHGHELVTAAGFGDMAGSNPAALKFAIHRPVVGAPLSPLPVSIRMRRPPALSASVMKVIGSASVDRKASAIACLTSLMSALRTRPSSGRGAKPSWMAVTSTSPTL